MPNEALAHNDTDVDPSREVFWSKVNPYRTTVSLTCLKGQTVVVDATSWFQVDAGQPPQLILPRLFFRLIRLLILDIKPIVVFNSMEIKNEAYNGSFVKGLYPERASSINRSDSEESDPIPPPLSSQALLAKIAWKRLEDHMPDWEEVLREAMTLPSNIVRDGSTRAQKQVLAPPNLPKSKGRAKALRESLELWASILQDVSQWKQWSQSPPSPLSIPLPSSNWPGWGDTDELVASAAFLSHTLLGNDARVWLDELSTQLARPTPLIHATHGGLIGDVKKMMNILGVEWKEVRGRARARAVTLASTLQIPILSTNRSILLFSGLTSPCLIYTFDAPYDLLLASLYPMADIRRELGIDAHGPHAIPLFACLTRSPEGLTNIHTVRSILQSFSSGTWGPWKGGDEPLQRFSRWWKNECLVMGGGGGHEDPFRTPSGPELGNLKRQIATSAAGPGFPNIVGFKSYATPPPTFVSSHPGGDREVWRDWGSMSRLSQVLLYEPAVERGGH
ncbi:hypothetical protein BJ684DRAFT_16029 [Piptocephalis cylindrospora]|uniref:PIN domain-like protein n=1 Tax=Piptocephalis cylindrospora TaxID=1907219 RepID=A0A4P9Y5T9_9FUNG|nr:hypothetical protein BJ684DRAFT_16029 [Piptocephalis cylindrospora]|eukprot:RKP13581.1 hypothetical protein BJ684DRAFT_16029 [Piptocephalis cylindrospora]